jgi:hypothetical protein
MPERIVEKYCAFQATETETSEAIKIRYLGNLARELPAAAQRRADKRKRYIETIIAYVKAGRERSQFLIIHPALNLPDPDTALLHCLFMAEGDVEHYASTLGVPSSALELYRFIYEAKVHDAVGLDAQDRKINDAETAVRFAIQWVDAIEPASDLSLLPTRLVHALLSDPEIGVSGLTSNFELRAALNDTAALHLRILEGDPPTREQWKKFQRSLLDYTDRARISGELGPLDDLVSQIAENSAIDCSLSTMIGDEIVALVAQARALAQVPDASYTPDEIALDIRIGEPRTQDKAALAEARKPAEVIALQKKHNEHFDRVCAIRAQALHRIAMTFIAMTGI